MTTHVIRGGRGTGRTTLLLLHACRTQTPILVKDRIRADCLRKHASMLGVFNLLPPIYTIQDVKLSYGFYGKHIERVAIDDVDDVLQGMLGNIDISMVTYTSHEDDKDLGFESLWLKNNPNLPKAVNNDRCCECKHFCDDGEYYDEDEDDWFDDVFCELGHYDHVGYHNNACCDFEKGE